MNPERWQRIEELFRAVADRPAAEREDYLTRACGGDAELRRDVLELVAHDTADSFLNNTIKKAAHAVTAAAPDELTGQRIGPYRLTRLIGRGGMGAVYEAVRDDDEFRKRVAIKLIKRGMESDFVRERFLRERQILASLDHPHIARLLDGGTTAEGQPYFVMEFVAGETITAYCNRRQLSLDGKLKLFRDVCSAVQHAHCALVIHRDLKPGNILVTEDGAPKLLDFGIAKLLATDPGEAVTAAEATARLMTPDYASPEQLRGGAITTATDVYSLGVVLYELLTARRPYQFETSAPLEIARTICDTEAPRPSEAARIHTAAPAKLARRLSGDLDNIVLMALRKEPERRYQSVERFSEDIRRHLAGLPVMAREDTFSYRAAKFVGRHKAGVAALVLLAALAATLAMSAARIACERDRANQAAATAEAVTQSLFSVFEFADPSRSRSNAITAQELLDQGTAKVVRELKDQPLVQAKLMDTIGGLYLAIGAYDRAQPLLADALELRRRTVGAERLDVAESLHHLAALAYQKGDHAGSETMYREALQLRRSLLGAKSLKTADSMAELGRVLDPFVSAGMGFVAYPPLVTAVSNAGGIGILGNAIEPPPSTQQLIRMIAEGTTGLFGVDLIHDTTAFGPATTDAHIDVCIAEGVKLVVFHFNVPPREWVDRLHAAGCRVWQQAASVEQAVEAAGIGVDAIVAQGRQAGGHNKSVTRTIPLLRQVVRAVSPLMALASGGIATGADVVEALINGADGVWVGTRMVASTEAFAHPEYKRRLLEAHGRATAVTTAFGPEYPNVPYRVLRTDLVQKVAGHEDQIPSPQPGDPPLGETVLFPFTLRVPYTMPQFSAVVPTPDTTGSFDLMGFPAGEDSVRKIKDVRPAAEIIAEMMTEAREILTEELTAMSGRA